MTDHTHDHPGQDGPRSCGRTGHITRMWGIGNAAHVTKDVAPKLPLDRAAPKAQYQSEPSAVAVQMHDPIPCILPLEV